MKIGIIGFGHLGKALAKGLLYRNIVSENEIFVLSKSSSTQDIADKEYGLQVCCDINDIIRKADILFWVIKGNAFTEVCNNIQIDITQKINVSFMAGMTIKSIQEKLGEVSVIRAMPSIAIDKANGVIGYTNTNDVLVKDIFNKLGYAFEIKENDIEKVTAFSACGLGFAAYILNAFQLAGQNFGFTPEVCEKIVSMTFGSVIEMGDFEKTTNAVATKGGATEQGIIHFMENDFKGIINEAMNRAFTRMTES